MILSSKHTTYYCNSVLMYKNKWFLFPFSRSYSDITPISQLFELYKLRRSPWSMETPRRWMTPGWWCLLEYCMMMRRSRSCFFHDQIENRERSSGGVLVSEERRWSTDKKMISDRVADCMKWCVLSCSFGQGHRQTHCQTKENNRRKNAKQDTSDGQDVVSCCGPWFAKSTGSTSGITQGS